MNQNTIEKNKKINKRQVINVLLMVVLIIAFASGVMLCIMKDSMAMMMVHKFSAVLFVIFCIIHMLQHRKRKEISHVS